MGNRDPKDATNESELTDLAGESVEALDDDKVKGGVLRQQSLAQTRPVPRSIDVDPGDWNSESIDY